MAVFKGTPLEPVIKVGSHSCYLSTSNWMQKMQEQETFHLKTFENLVTERRVRPTILNPLWSVVGYGLGDSIFQYLLLTRVRLWICTDGQRSKY
jgi:hypothetical protein